MQKIQYNYAPDENMEPLNDAESTIAVEELMTPYRGNARCANRKSGNR